MLHLGVILPFISRYYTNIKLYELRVTVQIRNYSNNRKQCNIIQLFQLNIVLQIYNNRKRSIQLIKPYSFNYLPRYFLGYARKNGETLEFS